MVAALQMESDAPNELRRQTRDLDGVDTASTGVLAAVDVESAGVQPRAPTITPLDSQTDAVTEVAPRQLPSDYEAYFMEVKLDERQREHWNHQSLLEWGCDRAPSAAVIPEIFDHAYVRLRISASKPLERASDEQRAEIERLQHEYLASCGDLLDESRALAQVIVEETNQPRRVHYFASREELLAADPELKIEQWGYVLGWRCDGAWCYVRFDSMDDAQLSANIRRIEEFKRVRDRAVKQIMAQVP